MPPRVLALVGAISEINLKKRKKDVRKSVFGVGNRGMETGMSCEKNSKRENLSNRGKVNNGKLYTNINLNSIYFNSTLVRLSSA